MSKLVLTYEDKICLKAEKGGFLDWFIKARLYAAQAQGYNCRSCTPTRWTRSWLAIDCYLATFEAKLDMRQKLANTTQVTIQEARNYMGANVYVFECLRLGKI